jgi:hypothetical protein
MDRCILVYWNKFTFNINRISLIRVRFFMQHKIIIKIKIWIKI